ncbi:WD domain, G-beta repeat protein [Mycena venus]|uniref:Pre-mRNA-splicing factor PRP46 n=1 Tax=Mycena venus TaxID=2733690 RepID=A0A8H7D609_9AGAR|nr:WD domain, G-beta repeat protein [Mycena venus]
MGHILTVRWRAVSARYPYLFSCGEDKMVHCWDLEANKIIRHYHRYLSGVYTLFPHPKLDVLVTAGRDTSARHGLHSPLWGLTAGKTGVTLTHHRKSIRTLAIHPTEYSFASGSSGGSNIKKWKCLEGAFVFNFSRHNTIINTLSVNAEGVFFSGADNRSLSFWDYDTGTSFRTQGRRSKTWRMCPSWARSRLRVDKMIKIYAKPSQ